MLLQLASNVEGAFFLHFSILKRQTDRQTDLAPVPKAFAEVDSMLGPVRLLDQTVDWQKASNLKRVEVIDPS